MRRTISLILIQTLLLGVRISCGEAPNAGPEGSSSPEASGTELPSSEEPPETEEPVTQKYETEYVAPADGSFTICGVPLSEYTILLYFLGTEYYLRVNYPPAKASGLVTPR